MSSIEREPGGLLGLPLELRQRIFKLVILNEDICDVSKTNVHGEPPALVETPNDCFHDDQPSRIGLLSVNHQIRAEAISELLRHCQLHFHTVIELAFMLRWVAAANASFSLAAHIQKVGVTIDSYGVNARKTWLEFIQQCTKLRVLVLELNADIDKTWTGQWVANASWPILGNDYPLEEWLRMYGFEELRRLRGFERVEVGRNPKRLHRRWGTFDKYVDKYKELSAWMEEAMCQPKTESPTELSDGEAE